MATDSTEYVSGLKELDAILKSLPAKVEGNVMRGALRAGQTVMLNGARAELVAQGSVDSGELLQSLTGLNHHHSHLVSHSWWQSRSLDAAKRLNTCCLHAICCRQG